jgi:sulfur-carrier protein adenylyltransferase/sulfurtransferase
MLTADEQQRYQRHLVLGGFGAEAQERLKQARVLVIGAGGLGCPALLYLAAAGVGRIVVVDSDVVEASNLQRQVLYSEADVGQAKAAAAAERLRALNRFIEVVPICERFDRENALALVKDCDVVIDGSDNFATRYLVNDACVMTDRPFVYGAIQGFDGQLSVFNWQGGPTYRCLFPTEPAADMVPNCAQAGVLGVLPGVVGTWQANEAIKLITGVGQPMSGKLLLWNALTMSTQTVVLHPDPNSRPIRALPANVSTVGCGGDMALEIDARELQRRLREGGVQLLDVREDWERATEAIYPSLHVPLPALLEDEEGESLARLRSDWLTVVYCAAGVRSLHAVEILRRRHGLANTRSLRGGMHAWLAQASR